MGKRRGAYSILVGDPGIHDGIFKMDLQEVGWGSLTRLIWLRIEQVGGSCECSYEPVGYGLCHSNNSGKMYSSAVGLCIFSKCTMYKQTS
jgi:hypothetical protein